MDLKEVFKILMDREQETSSMKKRIWKIVIIALKNAGTIGDRDNNNGN